MSSKKKQAELRNQKDWERIDNAVFESQHFIERYQKQLLIGIGVIVLAVCAYLAYDNFYVAPRTVDAQVALFRGEEYQRMGKDSLALHGDGNGYIGFEAIIDQFGSTKPGKLAKLYAGISYANMGKYEQALTFLKDYSGSDKIVSNLVNGTIGDCLDNMGKAEEAIPYFIKAAKALDNESQSPVLYKKAGLAYRDLGQYDKVVEIFTIIKNNYMKSPLAMEADKYIEEANILKAGK